MISGASSGENGGFCIISELGESVDNAHFFIDCNFGPIKDLKLLSEKLKMRTGIVEHGLFLGLATKVIVAGREGIKVLEK